MSNFTIKSPHFTSLVFVEEGSVEGQVDFIVKTPCGETQRIAAICGGRLHLFRLDVITASRMGLDLDSGNYPVIDYVDRTAPVITL